MKSWAQDVKQWLKWLVGDAPLPDKGEWLRPAATVAVLVVLAAGLLFTVRQPSGVSSSSTSDTSPPTPPSQGSSSQSMKNLYGAILAAEAANGSSSSSSSGATTGCQGATTVTAGTTKSGRAASKNKSANGAIQGTCPPAVSTSGSKQPKPVPVRQPSNRGSVSDPPKAVGPSDQIADPPAKQAPPPSGSGGPPPSDPPPSDPPPTNPPPTTPPGAPTNLTAAPGPGSVTLHWSPPQSSGSSEVIGYRIYDAPSGAVIPTLVNTQTLVPGSSYVVSGLTSGQAYGFFVAAVNLTDQSTLSSVSATPLPPSGGPTPDSGTFVGVAPTPDGKGYWEVDSLGNVDNFGDAPQLYPTPGQLPPPTGVPIVGIASTADGNGLWVVAANGQVITFGDASIGQPAPLPSTQQGAPVVGLTPTPDRQGFWEVTSDGQVFASGDAQHASWLPDPGLKSPVVALVADSSSGGYWEMAADGEVVASGGAAHEGSAVGATSPVVGAAVLTGGAGYQLVTADGTVYTCNSPSSACRTTGKVPGPLSSPFVSAAGNGSGGYWFLQWDGGIVAYGGAQWYGNI